MASGHEHGSGPQAPTISENSDAKPAFAAPEGGGFPRAAWRGTFAVAARLTGPGGSPRAVGATAADCAPQPLGLRIEVRSAT